MILPPQLLAVVETAKQFIDNKEEIPDAVMAQLVKGRLMVIKAAEKEKELKRQVCIFH